jgi:hypothetical protein
MHMRLTEQDDYLHPVEAASNYNESRYYNFFDPGPGLGGWVRLGNRPNEGYAEMSVCLYLPDGRVAFMYDRPSIDGNDAHDAGGLRFEVAEPFVEHRVDYDGKLVVLAEPRDMEDPRAAFTSNPTVGCRLELTHRALAPVWGGEPEADEDEELPEVDPGQAFARGHTEQLMGVTGTVAMDGSSFTVDAGQGLRDHSWGPRYWQSVWWYRWLTINLGDDLGLVATIVGTEGGDRAAHGFVYDRDRYGDDRLVPLRTVELSTDYDDRAYHRAVQVTAASDDATYQVDGEVWSSIPLRNRRQGLTTRIVEGMTTWRCAGRTGAGLSEYLDQIVDGHPVGLP